MLQNNIWLIAALFTLMLTSCIKRYEPDIPRNEAVKFVVTGQVTKGADVQRINVSTSAPITDPSYKYYVPVKGCVVRILDDKGNAYRLTDLLNGNYEIVIPDSKLVAGTAFKVELVTPKGVQIISDYDTLKECPEVDSVYYLLDQLPSADPFTQIKGIQFYIDLNATNTNCSNFRWEIRETWEYKAELARTEKLRTCWMNEYVRDIYTLSTRNLTENRYKLFPLHFVDNISSQRLLHGYSLLILQYSLSEAAYEYWEKIRINNDQQGGLYTKQPIQIKGNMHNITYPNQQVLGFFGASQVKTKRIFVNRIIELPLEYKECEEDPDPMAKPPPFCYDCQLSGGSNVMPDFWPR
jgi:hypothetical protein